MSIQYAKNTYKFGPKNRKPYFMVFVHVKMCGFLFHFIWKFCDKILILVILLIFKLKQIWRGSNIYQLQENQSLNKVFSITVLTFFQTKVLVWLSFHLFLGLSMTSKISIYLSSYNDFSHSQLLFPMWHCYLINGHSNFNPFSDCR